MVKKVYALVAGFFVLSLFFLSTCQALEPTQGTVSAEAKKEIIKLAKAELNNTVWRIDLKPMASSSSKKMEDTTDTLRFKDNKVGSDNLVKEGFNTSNYTVRIKGKDNDIIIWETMQTSEESGVAFWRGELRDGDTMRGVLSWHVTDKNKKDYTFVNKKDVVIAEEEVPPKADQPTTEVVVGVVEVAPGEVVEVVGVEEVVAESGDTAVAEIVEVVDMQEVIAEPVKEEEPVKKEKKKRGLF